MTINPSRRRPGLAPLELVMLFPFLMLLVAAIFFVARCAAARTAAATTARHDAFAARDAADPGVPLLLAHDAEASFVERTTSADVSGGVVFSGERFQAKAANTAMGRTWDEQDLPLPPTGIPFVPHVELFPLIGANALEPFDVNAAGLLRGLDVATDATVKPIAEAGAVVTDTVGKVYDKVATPLSMVGQAQAALSEAEEGLRLAALPVGGVVAPGAAAMLAAADHLDQVQTILGLGTSSLALLLNPGEDFDAQWEQLVGKIPVTVPAPPPEAGAVLNTLDKIVTLTNPLTFPQGITEMALEVGIATIFREGLGGLMSADLGTVGAAFSDALGQWFPLLGGV